MYYIDENGNRITLNAEQTEHFDDFLGSLKDNNFEFAELLLNDCPIIVKAYDDSEATLLFHTAGYEQGGSTVIAIAGLLVKKGADIHAKNAKGTTPLNIINIIENQGFKQAMCEAVGVGTIANLEAILDERAEAIARERATQEFLAEEEAKMAAEKKIADDAAAVKAARAQQINDATKVMRDPIIKAVFDTTQGEEAHKAIKELYAKEKSDKLIFSSDDSIEEILGEMFSKDKETIFDQETKVDVIRSWADWLGTDLKGLAYLLSLSIGSSHLPFFGSHGNGDDDFPEGPAGANSGIVYNNNPQSGENHVQFLGLTYNDTAIYLEVTNSPKDM